MILKSFIQTSNPGTISSINHVHTIHPISIEQDNGMTGDRDTVKLHNRGPGTGQICGAIDPRDRSEPTKSSVSTILQSLGSQAVMEDLSHRVTRGSIPGTGEHLVLQLPGCQALRRGVGSVGGFGTGRRSGIGPNPPEIFLQLFLDVITPGIFLGEFLSVSTF